MLLCAAPAPAHADAPATVAISGRVARARSGRHAVTVALWTADNFLGTLRPSGQAAARRRAALPLRRSARPLGRQRLRGRNDNGILDVGAFGPKSPTGSTVRPFAPERKPRFDDVDLKADGNLADTTVTSK